jgi:hypothetical protein
MVRWIHILLAGLAVWLVAAAAAGDELTLKSGRKYKGLVVEQSPQHVLFKIYTPSGGKMTVRYPKRMVASLDVDGKEPVYVKPKPRPSRRRRPSCRRARRHR